ncbi:MAG: metallophosphoesterase [bacterium]|nr:metallophosphoesterase [bacterium]
MKKFLCIIILFFTLIFLYAKYINVKGYKINEYEIKSSKITNGFNGFKIAHFSDILYQNELDYENTLNIINKINDENVNMVVFTGDVIKNANNNDLNKLGELFNKINADYKYAILGDNDNENIKETLLNNGFTVLNGNYVYVYNKDIDPIKILDANNFDTSLLENEEDINPSFVIGLLHKPDDFQTLKNYNIDVIFAGHSLGGQIRIPFWGAIIKKDGAKIYIDNYYNDNNSQMYVSYGIGTEKTNLRFLNKPSFNLYRLKSK